ADTRHSIVAPRKKKKAPFPGPSLYSFNRRRSARLGVAEVHGTAVGVVQVEVPRTAVELEQFRIAVTDGQCAERDLGVPRSIPCHLHVVGGVAANLQTRDHLTVINLVRILLAIDVVDVPGESEVTPGPVVGQVGAQVRAAQAAGLLNQLTIDGGDVELVDVRHGQAVLQATGGTEIKIGVGAEVDTIGLQVTLVRVTGDNLGDAARGVAGDAQAIRDRTILLRIAVHIDNVLGTDRRDRVLDLDVVVVDAQVQPIDRIVDHAEGVLLRLLRRQRRVGDEVGVDLLPAGRRQAQRGTGLRIVDRL